MAVMVENTKMLGDKDKLKKTGLLTSIVVWLLSVLNVIMDSLYTTVYFYFFPFLPFVLVVL